MIYENIESGKDTTIDGVTETYNTLTEDNYEAITDDAINQFNGWEEGKGSLRDIVGKYWKEGERGTNNY